MNTAEAWDRAHLWRFRARVHRVIDGDTFVALADCGFRVAALPHIRLSAYDAAEAGHPDGAAAKFALQSAFVLYDGGADWPLRIESVQRVRVVGETATFDRYVALVWLLRRDGSMVDIRDVLKGMPDGRTAGA